MTFADWWKSVEGWKTEGGSGESKARAAWNAAIEATKDGGLAVPPSAIGETGGNYAASLLSARELRRLERQDEAFGELGETLAEGV